MITGTIRGVEARIRLIIRGSSGREEEIEAIIDTGYSSWLTLPPATIARLGLRWRGIDQATLADGSQCSFDVYVGTVVWDGQGRRTLIDEADADPLVGMGLLKGYELKVQVRPRGKVTIKRFPRSRGRRTQRS